MLLYLGTSRQNLTSIQSDGIIAPSYWGTEAMAKQYAASFGKDGLVLVANIAECDLQANMLVANAMYENGDLDHLPMEDDLAYSLVLLEGIVCTVDIVHASVLEPAPASSRKRMPMDEGMQP